MNDTKTPAPVKPKHRIEYYQSSAADSNKWFWRLKKTAHGKNQADGSEGYATRGNVERVLKQLKSDLNLAIPIVEIDAATGKVVKTL